jgi:two-component system, NtrC family, nitrogen regulation sensor histidine kinase NtrY
MTPAPPPSHAPGSAARPARLGWEQKVLLLALVCPLPAVALGLVLLWTGDFAPKVQTTFSLVAIVAWLGGAFAVRERVMRALQTLSSLLGALREGDYSFRGRPSRRNDALAEALAEVNSLAETLSRQRTGAVEASALLGKVMAEIDVAIFAFDSRAPRLLRLVNRAGARLLGRPEANLVGSAASDLAMDQLLEGPAPRTVKGSFPGGPGPWELRRSVFRLGGLPHELMVLTDVRRALRQEELAAWQRLVRVLGHEINNSLAPIQSIAGDLQHTLRRPGGDRPDDWEEDLVRGLAVIERRAEALGRFMTSYARLARLPPPRLAPVELTACLRRIVELEKRLEVRLAPGPELTVLADADQLEQLLINIVHNAVDAALETSGAVEIRCRKLAGEVEIAVCDDGPGVASTENLFVPFFTTKPSGSGIGLALSRQIAEAHRGTLTLENRRERRGAIARLRLPL